MRKFLWSLWPTVVCVIVAWTICLPFVYFKVVDPIIFVSVVLGAIFADIWIYYKNKQKNK